ncbi:hypothetical protein J2Z65_003303 [Paenibacillus aceris]|uniref:Uncharacterized protein n=1 Tax=Paenibacillus aceris TaxID=869555 RepID=A0ABS4HZI5_9BACL|nr:hypothetical protein [Paenibacillus aceris]
MMKLSIVCVLTGVSFFCFLSFVLYVSCKRFLLLCFYMLL